MFAGMQSGYTAYGQSVSSGVWQFAAFTYAAGSSNVILYLNSNSQSFSILGPLNTVTSQALIGGASGGASYFGGTISNVQLYNTSLDTNSVLALYKEGIGGAPINTQNLVGWWPLNGDANDYSGNGYNGAPTAMSYTNQWTSGYITPSH
jgi:hypothetical protein